MSGLVDQVPGLLMSVNPALTRRCGKPWRHPSWPPAHPGPVFGQLHGQALRGDETPGAYEGIITSMQAIAPAMRAPNALNQLLGNLPGRCQRPPGARGTRRGYVLRQRRHLKLSRCLLTAMGNPYRQCNGGSAAGARDQRRTAVVTAAPPERRQLHASVGDLLTMRERLEENPRAPPVRSPRSAW
jgi:hypothetical protein